MLFLVEERRCMKSMAGAFNKKLVFLGEIVNMTGQSIKKLSVLLRPNTEAVLYMFLEDIYLTIEQLLSLGMQGVWRYEIFDHFEKPY